MLAIELIGASNIPPNKMYSSCAIQNELYDLQKYEFIMQSRWHSLLMAFMVKVPDESILSFKPATVPFWLYASSHLLIRHGA